MLFRSSCASASFGTVMLTMNIESSPQSITEVNPGELSIFIVNITVPKDAEAQEFNIGISAAADEAVTRKETLFKIAALSVLPIEVQNIEGIQKIPVLQILTKNGTNIILVIFILVGIFVILRIKERKDRRYGREEILRKVRETIK